MILHREQIPSGAQARQVICSLVKGQGSQLLFKAERGDAWAIKQHDC